MPPIKARVVHSQSGAHERARTYQRLLRTGLHFWCVLGTGMRGRERRLRTVGEVPSCADWTSNGGDDAGYLPIVSIASEGMSYDISSTWDSETTSAFASTWPLGSGAPRAANVSAVSSGNRT